jgi:small subunit ribosomal protein S3Ae
MGKQRMKDLELKEKEKEEKEKAKEKEKEERPKRRPEAAPGAKKWKGKDWFVIFSPRMFGERVIGETPATNPKGIVGRNIEVGLPELTGQRGRDFYRVVLAIDRIDNRCAYTRFNGYVTLKEHVMRMVRKRAQKIESIMDVKTKDGWKLHVNSVAILNRNTETAVKKKARAHIEKAMGENAAGLGIEDFIRAVISSNLQRNIKKSGAKIYPVRFFEVLRIRVTGMPEGK